MKTKMKLAVATAATAAMAMELERRHSVSHDLKLAGKMVKFGRSLRKSIQQGVTTADAWEEVVDERPNQPALVFVEDGDNGTRQFTYKQLDEYANQVAHFLASQGVKKMDDIALFMENRPEFIGIWLGIAKLGARVTMVNTAVKEKGLVHCIKTTNSTCVIYGKELEEPLEAIRSELGSMKIWVQGVNEPESLDTLVKNMPKTRPSALLREGVTPHDPYGYIFTSGTTGLPKAAIIPHTKIVTGRSFKLITECEAGKDVVYTCLPLFHSSAGVIGCGMLFAGCTMVLRRRFSAHKFFEDCARNNVTVVQYIGELCRYLLASPPSKFDQAHKIRVAIGNGLRPEIWRQFQERFNIPEIVEFYGATEMNGILYNHCKNLESVGCVGRLGSLGKLLTGTRIVRYSVEDDAVIRNEKGFCTECAPGEIGQLLIQIRKSNDLSQFRGYSDKKATERKIARDIFQKGDEFFCSGDLLTRDDKGYYRFVDRIGDTFRWKGENCSTMEVSEVVSAFPGVLEANVYGVLVPNNQDGRAPCAAITLEQGKNLDFTALLAHMKKNLPPYAVPLFLRLMPQIDITATFKHQKVDLRNQGIDIAVVQDPLYFLQDGKSYIKIDPELYGRICTPFSKL